VLPRQPWHFMLLQIGATSLVMSEEGLFGSCARALRPRTSANTKTPRIVDLVTERVLLPFPQTFDNRN